MAFKTRNTRIRTKNVSYTKNHPNNLQPKKQRPKKRRMENKIPSTALRVQLQNKITRYHCTAYNLRPRKGPGPNYYETRQKPIYKPHKRRISVKTMRSGLQSKPRANLLNNHVHFDHSYSEPPAQQHTNYTSDQWGMGAQLNSTAESNQANIAPTYNMQSGGFDCHRERGMSYMESTAGTYDRYSTTYNYYNQYLDQEPYNNFNFARQYQHPNKGYITDRNSNGYGFPTEFSQQSENPYAWYDGKDYYGAYNKSIKEECTSEINTETPSFAGTSSCSNILHPTSNTDCTDSGSYYRYERGNSSCNIECTPVEQFELNSVNSFTISPLEHAQSYTFATSDALNETPHYEPQLLSLDALPIPTINSVPMDVTEESQLIHQDIRNIQGSSCTSDRKVHSKKRVLSPGERKSEQSLTSTNGNSITTHQYDFLFPVTSDHNSFNSVVPEDVVKNFKDSSSLYHQNCEEVNFNKKFKYADQPIPGISSEELNSFVLDSVVGVESNDIHKKGMTSLMCNNVPLFVSPAAPVVDGISGGEALDKLLQDGVLHTKPDDEEQVARTEERQPKFFGEDARLNWPSPSIFPRKEQ